MRLLLELTCPLHVVDRRPLPASLTSTQHTMHPLCFMCVREQSIACSGERARPAGGAREAGRQRPDGGRHGSHAGAEAPGLPGQAGGPGAGPGSACKGTDGSQVIWRGPQSLTGRSVTTRCRSSSETPERGWGCVNMLCPGNMHTEARWVFGESLAAIFMESL